MKNHKKLLSVLSIVLCCMLATSLVFAAETTTEDKPKADEPKVEAEKDKKAPEAEKDSDVKKDSENDRPNWERRRGRRGDGQMQFDPAEMRNRMQERMLEVAKEHMKITDEEEWAVIKPRLSKVFKLSDNNNGMANVMRSMFRRNFGGANAKKSTEPVQIATDELQDTLDKEAPTNAEIQAKLTALRGAREKNRQALITAQQELKEILTLKQEALLVMAGMLE